MPNRPPPAPRTPDVVAADCERDEMAVRRALAEMDPEPCECCEHGAWLEWVGRFNELVDSHRRRTH